MADRFKRYGYDNAKYAYDLRLPWHRQKPERATYTRLGRQRARNKLRVELRTEVEQAEEDMELDEFANIDVTQDD